MAGIPQTDTVTATDSGTGSANAATAIIGETRTLIGVFWDGSGAGTLTVEAEIDGSWEPFDTVTTDSGTGVEIYETPYEKMRAYLDANRNKVVLTSKGVS